MFTEPKLRDRTHPGFGMGVFRPPSCEHYPIGESAIGLPTGHGPAAPLTTTSGDEVFGDIQNDQAREARSIKPNATTSKTCRRASGTTFSAAIGASHRESRRKRCPAARRG